MSVPGTYPHDLRCALAASAERVRTLQAEQRRCIAEHVEATELLQLEGHTQGAILLALKTLADNRCPDRAPDSATRDAARALDIAKRKPQKPEPGDLLD